MAYESDPIASKLNELVSRNEAYMWLSWFDELKLPDQVLLGVWELANEVYNGGFLQYFHNSSRDHFEYSRTTVKQHRSAARLTSGGTAAH